MTEAEAERLRCLEADLPAYRGPPWARRPLPTSTTIEGEAGGASKRPHPEAQAPAVGGLIGPAAAC